SLAARRARRVRDTRRRRRRFFDMDHHRLGTLALIAALAFAGTAAASHPPTKHISRRDPRYAVARLAHGVVIYHRTFSTWWASASGSSLPCSAAPASVLADLGVACRGPAGVAWIDSCGPMQSAPRTLVLACGDGNYYLTDLSWRNWGKSTATAT